ncbi:PQQ-binding-like beta-propeller repeat protein [Nonomuraea sp. NPDC050451]|uniref:outer membrane protein assembly factor BamB family protein n=1 Tax=Nonomuraea sp. NPDC050451 TaxID=3364364 RepID=UPI0037B1F8FA
MNHVPPHLPHRQPWGAQPYGQPPIRRRNRTAGRSVVDVTLVAVMLVAAGVLLAAGILIWEYDDGPKGTGGYRAWSAAAEKLGIADVKVKTAAAIGKGALASNQGTAWFTQTHFVHRKSGKVVSYEIATGKLAWEYRLPSDDRCPSSAEQVDGRVVITTGGGSRIDCTTLTLLDIGTGKKVWQTELPSSGPRPATYDAPVVHGKRVAISAGHGYYLLDLATGVPETVESTQGCRRFSFTVVDGLLLARRVCPATGDGLEAFGEAGESVWQWSLPQAQGEGENWPKLAQVLSADPLVVMVTLDPSSRDAEVWKVDREFGRHTTVWKGTDGDTSPCDPHAPGLRHCPRGAIIGEKLVLHTVRAKIYPSAEKHEGTHNHANTHGELFAVDLETGKTVWTTPVIQNRTLGVITVADGKIIAYQEALPPQTRHRRSRKSTWAGVPGLVVAIDPATGRDTPLMALPSDSTTSLRNLTGTSSFGRFGTSALWDGKRLAIYNNESLNAFGPTVDAVVFE